MLKVNQIKLPFRHSNDELIKAICKKMKITSSELLAFDIVKRSLDARQSKKSGHAGEIMYQYAVSVTIKNEKAYLKKNKNHDITAYEDKKYVFPKTLNSAPKEKPIIIGAGPAGLFCALILARHGFAPVVLERGSDVRTRIKKVESFWENGQLDPECNVQFGEGGAGTFSDGKLNTLVKDPTGRHRQVLKMFVEAGAPEDILYVQKPHVGTDLLVGVVEKIREEIIRLGGKVCFDTTVTDFIFDEKQKLKALELNHDKTIDASTVVLAIGHSARDTFELLHHKQMNMEPKPFAIGVRIEHPQAMINQSQYGADAEDLPAADYKLTYQTANGRNVYTFCMCPGGYVVNASSEKEMLAVNGMSNRKRDSRNANSAVIVNVTPEDFPGTHPLAGMAFQREWEKKAYQAGDGKVPVQLFGDFKAHRISEAFQQVLPEHKGEVTFADLHTCLPGYVCESLIEGIDAFGQKIKGYDRSDAILSGVETRTSSPVRMKRDEHCESNLKGIYPCGEGAGYAGGITSAAMDGLRVAEAIANRYMEA